MSGVPQVSVLLLGPVLFLVFVNNIDKRVKNSILKFAADTKIFGGMQSEVDRVGLQGDLDSLFALAHDWKMELNVEKCKYAHREEKSEFHLHYEGNTSIFGAGRSRKTSRYGSPQT